MASKLLLNFKIKKKVMKIITWTSYQNIIYHKRIFNNLKNPIKNQIYIYFYILGSNQLVTG